MREYRAKKKAAKTKLLPKALVRRLHAQGIDVQRWVKSVPVSLDDYRARGRLLEAKSLRIEWQSSGIRGLHQKIAELEGTISMMRAMGNSEDKQRIMQVEADLARLEVMMDSMLSQEVYGDA